MTNPRILLLGPPGSGKGTQSENIVERYGVDHIETGDMFRSNKDMDISHLDVAYDTPGEFMDRGDLVPDAVVNEMVKSVIEDANGFVLDGYPRTMNQVEFLSSITDLDVAVYIEVPQAELVRRLTGRRMCSDCGATYHVDFDPPAEAGVCDECGAALYQREDDQEDVVRERISVYEEKTAPVVSHYEDQGTLERVDGDDSPEAVWEALAATLDAAIDG